MPPFSPQIPVDIVLSDLWMKRLKALWADMDEAYAAVAAAYGFNCRGCEENCCRTRFYHHTLLEYLCLHQGFQQLDTGLQRTLRRRAQVVSDYQASADRELQHADHLCPLNLNGLCCLYAYRPMICRLHGIPHELHPGDGRVVSGPGCDAFVAACGQKPHVIFDRTPFYRQMAALEQQLRRESGYPYKIKMTVAEMVACF